MSLFYVWVGLSTEHVVQEASGHFVLVLGFLPARTWMQLGLFLLVLLINQVLFKESHVA